jgi:ABC-type transporter Mla subunit MlaD
LLWTYFSKSNLEALENEIEALCVSMQRHVEDTGSEAAISAQIAILGEVLNESREQVGQLKRFETDFAVAIGKALGSQMQPAFEQLTVSITNALNALTEKVGTMNEDALKKMMIDFQSAIKEHSGKEMEAFKQTLVDIAQQIKEAAEKLEGAGGTAGDAIKEGGKQFTDALAGGAGDLRQAANFLENAMITAKATVNDMDETLERATAEGRLGLDNLNNVLMRLTTTVAEVTNLVTTIQGASSDFSSAATAAATATGNLEKVIADQNNLVNTVSEAAQTLGSSLITANQEFRTSAQTMANTTQEINSGIENYSQKLGELHVSLDESLAKAIGSLNSTISELVDGLDDFLEEVRKGER